MPHITKDRYQIISESIQDKKMFEHVLFDGRLVSTKVFYENGNTFSCITLNNKGVVQSSVIYNVDGKVNHEYELNPNSKLLNQCKIYNANELLLYKGEILNGEKSGYGIGMFLNRILLNVLEYNENGVSIYEGSWLKDKKHNNGIEFYENGNKKYEGNFENGYINWLTAILITNILGSEKNMENCFWIMELCCMMAIGRKIWDMELEKLTI